MSQIERLQDEVDCWLREYFGSKADSFRPWFNIRNESHEGILTLEEVQRLVEALLHCPHYAYHFDVHPRESFDTWTFETYVEPAGLRAHL